MARHALLAWADDTLKPAAELAHAENDEAACGSWCGFCKAKATCRARAKANLELAKHEFRVPPLLGSLVEKPQDRPMLIPQGDKRPPMGDAKTDFNDKEEDNDND